jgi:zinc transport system ATP-binding protein
VPIDEGDPGTAGTTDVLHLRHGTLGYEDRPVLREIDFTLRAGEVVVLLGANGSGKSTLVRTLLGLTPLMAGHVELFGVPSSRFTQRWRIGYVPQRHTVVSGVPSTVREVVSSGRLARRRPFAPLRAEDRAAVEAAIATVGLQEKAGSNVAALSGGQQRRVLIARALAAEPDVLVMDEPTAGVDLANQEILAETLRRLVASGKTVLLVAHELGPLEPPADRVVVLRDGRTTYDGPPLPGIAEAHDHHAHHDETPPDESRRGGIEPTG